jgi:octopine/nopaline transport system substrate-binding protein
MTKFDERRIPLMISRRTVLKGGLLAGWSAIALRNPVLAQSPRKLRFATEGAFPPYNQTAPNGAIIGFEPDMVKAIAERAGFTYELIPQAWDGVIQGLIDGKFDAIVDGVSITQKRLEVVSFSLPYIAAGSSFATMNANKLTLPGAGETVNLDDAAATEKTVADLASALKGKIVAVQVATIQLEFLNRYLADKGVTIRTYQATAETYQDLQNGRVDAVMASVSNLATFVQKNSGIATISGPRLIGGVIGQGSAIVLRKNDAELQELFNKALRSLAQDGTLQDLSKKWFGLDLVPRY